jgi:parallel beta-helix repeat protein
VKRAALFTVAALVLTACEDATQPESTTSDQSPRFATLNVPGDFSSIQAAHDAARSGDTILVTPGTYVGQITITKAITLASLYLTTGDESFISGTILDGGGADFVIAIPSNAEEGSTIQGFTIQNANDGIAPRAMFRLLNCLVRNTSDGVDYGGGEGSVVQFCTFELNSDDGIDLDNSVDIVIQDNIIRNNGDDGIEIRLEEYSGPTLDIIIRGNEIYGNGEDGIQLIDYDVPTDRFFEIAHNYIYDNADAGIGMMDGALSIEDFRAASIPERINIFNNTFANNSHGITGGDNTVVLNNIFVGHSVIAVKKVDGNSELAYNLFFDNGTDNSGSNVDVGSSVYADPLLTADLELSEGSPAIDAGTSLYVWHGTTVLDLPATSFSGGAPDIGAFESLAPGGPIADFTWAAEPFLTVEFSDASTDPNGTVTAWSWDFGDGTTSTMQNPTHTYSFAGVYTVKLTVTDNDGLTSRTTRSIPVGPQAPTADFTWAASELSVDFTDKSADADGTVTAWSWDFGDGATSMLQNPSHTYATSGSYAVTLTVTDSDEMTDATTQAVSVVSRTGDVIYVTSTGGGTVGGVSFEDEDILAYDGDTETWSLHFDGSDVGLDGSNDRDVRAFALLANGEILLRLNNATTLPDVGSVDPSDILRFSGSTGPTTSGTYSLYLRGADVGLAGEEIDAIGFAPDGRLVVSTEGGFSVPGASGEDEDLIALDPGGSIWSLYFDGSDVNLADSSDEDVTGVWIDDLTGDVYLTAKGAFAVPGVSGDSSAVFACKPDALGSATSCRFASYWSGSAHGLTSNDVIGIHIGGSAPPANQAPTASFTWTATDLTVDFSDTSTDPDGTVTAWSWDFGDGSTSTQQNPSHTYAAEGDYTVTLTVTDNDGATSAEAAQTVSVTEPPPANQAPTASFTWSATDLTVDFTDTSTDPDGTVTAWSWDFGDGNTSTEQSPSHTYAAANDYTVTLTVTDNDGATSAATTRTVTVTEPPPANQAPTASFAWSATELAADFTDTSSDPDGTVVEWTWDFGDGTTSTEQNPSHTYAAANDYTVTLTVTDNDGATSAATTQTVTVTEPPPANQAPTASFTWTATDLTVDFTDTSTDPDGTLVGWSWDFGDGSTSTQQNPSHTYAAANDYTVTLTVTDNDGATGTFTDNVTASDPPAEVTISTIEPNTMAAGSSIDVTIYGSGFVSGATLAFENGSGPAPSASYVEVLDGSTIRATLQVKSGGPKRDRLWDLRVSNPDGSSGVLVGGLTVTKQ